MAVVRTNPLPAGRYWIYVFRPGYTTWVEWRTAYQDVLTIERQEGVEAPLLPGVSSPATGHSMTSESMWILFRTSEPTTWPQVELGFPTIAEEAGLKERTDIEQAPPPPPSVGETIDNAVEGAETAVERVGQSLENLAFAALVIWGISRVMKD